MTTKICQHCKKEFVSKRSDRKHCSASCKAAAHAARRDTPAVPSDAMKTLGLLLGSLAPPGTVGYRLAIPLCKLGRVEESMRHELYWFPRLDHRRSVRWDGSFSDRPFFALTTTHFEPPRVPLAATYVVHFIDEKGLVLATPAELAGGVKVIEAARMSWPGTHGVRQGRGGSVRNLIELAKLAASSSKT